MYEMEFQPGPLLFTPEIRILNLSAYIDFHSCVLAQLYIT